MKQIEVMKFAITVQARLNDMQLTISKELCKRFNALWHSWILNVIYIFAQAFNAFAKLKLSGRLKSFNFISEANW